jgi:Mn-dependent DtxR family transcriptional regulator
MNTATITEKCQSVLDVIIDRNQNYDPCYVSDIVMYLEMSKNEVKGYITDLRNKKLIAPHDPDCGELHAMNID